MESLFPMFVKLTGRKCLVVGAGPVAESKITGLLHAGASVHVVAPSATAAVAAWADEGRLTWSRRAFEAADLELVSLVVVATSSHEVNEAVFRLADARGIFCNAVDQPDRCHFYYPAVVRRGNLQIAISTAGLSPSLAHRLRIELEAQFGPEYEVWVEWLGAARKRLFALQKDPAKRRRVLERLASRPMFDSFLHHPRRSRGAA